MAVDGESYDAPMSLTVGETFAGYRIIGRVDSGESGQVFLAEHPQSGRRDALYVLPAELSADARYRTHFAEQADLAAALSHPNVPTVYERGESDGRLWMSAELVEGVSAAELMRVRYRSGMPPEEVLSIVTAAASALDHARSGGLLHGDVTPANIRLTEQDSAPTRIHLMGFGIARPPDATPGLTANDTGLDTVAYAAPELLIDEDVDGRSDEYALACTAFHLLTGSVPYPSTNAAQIINKHVMAPPPSIGDRNAKYARLDSLFTTALAKDPNVRYPSCGDFAAELQRRLRAPHDAETPRTGAVPEPAFADPVPAAWTPSSSGTAASLAGPTSSGPKQRVRIKNRWWRRPLRGFSEEPWTRRKITIAVLAAIGILAMTATTFAAVLTPLLTSNAGQEAARPSAAAPTPTAPPVIGKPLAVRVVLAVPLQPTPGQCPKAPPPEPPAAQQPLQACAVDDMAVYELGPVALMLNLTGATSAKLPMTEFHTVQMSMDAASTAAFAQLTAANLGKQLAFVRDGVVLAAPMINEPINGATLQISGELTGEAAGTIARLLRDGS